MSEVSFTYHAMDRAGKECRGVVSAASRDQAFREIVQRGLTPLTIKYNRKKVKTRGKKIKTQDISQFTYQLRVLLEARIPIGDGLSSIAQQEENPTLRKILLEIATSVESGQTIAKSMEPYRSVFGDVYIETIKAAEQSGTMLQTLDHLSEAVERMEESRRQVVGALIYPACVIITLILAVSFLIVFTIPKFANMYASRGMELPLLTTVLAGFGQSVKDWWWAYLPTMVGMLYFVRYLFKHHMPFLEKIFHKIPVVEQVLVALSVARFSRVFSVSLSAGLGLLDSIEMGRRASGRAALNHDATVLGNRIRAGQQLADGLADATYLPAFAKRMFIAGEQSGELVRLSGVVAKHYERETMHKIKALTTVIEPVLVVTIAVVVLMIALAIFLPMWNMVQLMS